jgi:hypothetical protein
MKNLILSALFILPLVVSGQVEFSSSRQSGLQIYRAKTVNGTVTVNLPEKLYPGETVSGSVITEPLSTGNAKKNEKNQTALLAVKLWLFGQQLSLTDQLFQFTVPEQAGSPAALLELQPGRGIAAHTPVEILEGVRPVPAMESPAFPGYLRSGEYQSIPGRFDGDRRTTRLMAGNTELPVIAESPGELVTMVPDNLSGRQTLTLSEGDRTYSAGLNVVSLTLAADATSLKKGEQTTLHLVAGGLEGVDFPVTIQVENRTPLNISLSGGNSQEWVITPEEIGAGGIAGRDFQITAGSTGGFTVSAIINEPWHGLPAEPMDQNREGTTEYCGKTWEEVTDIGKPEGPRRDKTNSAGTVKPGNAKQRCDQCSKKTEITTTSYPLYLYQKQKKITYTCSLLKGHAGACHGSGMATETEKKMGPVGYEEVGTCPKGHVVWRKK